MRFKEIQLNEANMSPTALEKAAAGVQAVVGMEFEMIVTGITPQIDNEYDYHHPKDPWDNISSILDIHAFFTNPTATVKSSNTAINKFIDWLKKLYNNYTTRTNTAQLDREVFQYGYNYILKYLNDHPKLVNMETLEKDALSKLKINYPELFTSIAMARSVDIQSVLTPTKIRLLREKASDYTNLTFIEIYNAATEYWKKEHAPSERNFLDHAFDCSVTRMYNDYTSHMLLAHSNEFNADKLYWPYNRKQATPQKEIEDVVHDFSKAIGKKTVYGDNYHTVARKPDQYIVEPDESINTDTDDERGLEFISPPMPLEEMLVDLKKVMRWAGNNGCFTNSSTGLHMNVSIPNIASLDYVKLILFLGDVHVLKEFKRMSNDYTRSSLVAATRIMANLNSYSGHSTTIKEIASGLQSNLADAAKIIFDHLSDTEKYFSVHNKHSYIEFRAPGGDWLNIEYDKLKNTLHRFVVALDIACDPNKYRQEYGKKLYYLTRPVAPESIDDRLLNAFASYNAGIINISRLKAIIHTLQAERSSNDKSLVNYVWQMTPIHAIHVPNAPRVDLPSAFTVVAPDQFTARNNATVLLLRNELYKKNADIIGFAAKRIGIYNKENNNEST